MAEPSPDAIHTVECHLQGVTRLCFTPDGATIFTGGNDQLVRQHDAEDLDSEPNFVDQNDSVTSIAASNEYLVTASVDNIVRRFVGTEPDGFVTRASGVPVRWVSFDKAGERLAVCSDELLVKIIHVKERREVKLEDSESPVRSAAWDPEGKFLVTAGCDGKLKVYDTLGSEPLNIKIMDGMIPPSESDSTTSMYATWHPSGKFFAIPLRTNDIGVVAKDGWAKTATFANGHRAPVSELAWSPNGRYLASAAGSEILIWRTDNRAIVARYTNAAPVTDLAWSPKANLLAFTDSRGFFLRWTAPIPDDLESPVLSEAAIAKKLDKLLDDDDIFGDGDDLEDKGDDIGDEFGDDWIIDDDGTYANADNGEKQWAAGRTEVVNVTKAQDSFVPGSTQWRNKKRYLAFNMIGVVEAVDQETHQVVTVEFHDKSARRGYHFSDQAKYTMASLGAHGIVYAVPSEGETPSMIHYRPYEAWGASSEWSMSLLPVEDVVSVVAGGSASGAGAVVVATSRGFVRFLTGSGVQRYLWRVGDDVVTMAADRDSLLVVHREGGTSLDGCQNLRYTLLDLDDYDILQEGRVPLPRKTTLTWVGFSDGAPVMYDSAGLLSVLDRSRRPGQARWVPLLDGAAAAAAKPSKMRESYWPVDVSRTHLTCVLLRGEREPGFPRPILSEVDLCMPLLGLGENEAQGKLAESVVRSRVLASSSNDDTVATDRQLLQLLQAACKADELARALDITRMMSLPVTLDGAEKLAVSLYRHHALGQKIAALRQQKEGGTRRSVPVRDARERVRERESSPARRDPAREFASFSAPRRRMLGRDRPVTPGAGSVTVVPATPGEDDDAVGVTPGFDDDIYAFEDSSSAVAAAAPPPAFAASPPKRKREREDDPFAQPKNPFAKKEKAANPFAKPASVQSTARPLDSVKSTSFFDRVDDIEGHKPKRKAPAPAKPAGKQMSLAQYRRPKPTPKDSYVSTATETDIDAETFPESLDDETQQSNGVLEETLIQQTVGDDSHEF